MTTSTDILTTITKPDGYQSVGHWSADGLSSILYPGEIAVTEVFADVDLYSRMEFFNQWYAVTGYLPTHHAAADLHTWSKC